VRRRNAICLAILLVSGQGAAMAASAPLSPTRLDVGHGLAAYAMRNPEPAMSIGDRAAGGDEGALAQRMQPVRQAEVDTLLGLATRFEVGRGVAPDPKQAFAYYQAAALRGDGFAQEQLGRYYETGLGVPRDIDQALRWYHAAAEQNYPAAQLSLVRLLSGEGVASRAEQAYLWALVALANPALPVDRRVFLQRQCQALESQLRPAQRDAVRDQARSWKTAGPDH